MWVLGHRGCLAWVGGWEALGVMWVPARTHGLVPAVFFKSRGAPHQELPAVP